jgi:hypothetical protein
MDGPLPNALGAASIMVVGACFLVGGLPNSAGDSGDEQGMPDGDDRPAVPAVTHHAAIPGSERRYRAASALLELSVAASAASVSSARTQSLPFRVLPDRYFPALSLLPGHRPAELAA